MLLPRLLTLDLAAPPSTSRRMRGRRCWSGSECCSRWHRSARRRWGAFGRGECGGRGVRQELELVYGKQGLGLEEQGQRSLRILDGGHAAEWFVDTVEEGKQQHGVVDGLLQISEPVNEVLKPLGELEHR